MNYTTIEAVKRRWGTINTEILANYDNVSTFGRDGERVLVPEAGDCLIESLIYQASRDIDFRCNGYYIFPTVSHNAMVEQLCLDKVKLLIDSSRHFQDDTESYRYAEMKKRYEYDCARIRNGVYTLEGVTIRGHNTIVESIPFPTDQHAHFGRHNRYCGFCGGILYR